MNIKCTLFHGVLERHAGITSLTVSWMAPEYIGKRTIYVNKLATNQIGSANNLALQKDGNVWLPGASDYDRLPKTDTIIEDDEHFLRRANLIESCAKAFGWNPVRKNRLPKWW